MNFSIQQKLALVLSLAALSLCLAIYVGVSRNFSTGFNDYLTERRVSDAEKVAEYIRENFSASEVDALFFSPRSWHRAVRAALGISSGPGRGAHHNDNAGRPHKHGSKGFPRQPPKAPHRRGAPPPWESFVLLDTNRQVMFNRPPSVESWPQVPVKLASEKLIAYIAIEPITHIENDADRLFAERQNRLFVVVVLLATAIAIVLSWPVAKLLTRPIRKLSGAINDIANLRFSRPIDVRTNDEIGQLANDINGMADRLQQHESIQREWMAQISHDLRTPIAIMRAEIEAAQDGVRPLTPSLLKGLHEESQRLSQLVDEFHEFATIDSPYFKLNRRKTDLQQLLETVSRQFSSALFAHDLKFEYNILEPGLHGFLDEKRMLRVLSNLMQNSLRYTDGPGLICCQVSAGSALTIQWEDAAPGVPDDELGKILEPMYRVEKSRNRLSGGSGLGLTIVTAIVKAHGGTVVAGHSPLGGLKITITIPVEIS